MNSEYSRELEKNNGSAGVRLPGVLCEVCARVGYVYTGSGVYLVYVHWCVSWCAGLGVPVFKCVVPSVVCLYELCSSV